MIETTAVELLVNDTCVMKVCLKSTLLEQIAQNKSNQIDRNLSCVPEKNTKQMGVCKQFLIHRTISIQLTRSNDIQFVT